MGGIMNDLVKKWKLTGLLDETRYLSYAELRELREKKSREQELAETLESFADQVLAEDKKIEPLNEIIFPLVRRVYDEGKGLIADYPKLKELYFELWEKNKDIFESSAFELDSQFEFTALMSETYVERYGVVQLYGYKEGEEPDEAE